MREKELRLALVCYGGISLAVYMHGISKEIWRLARASEAFLSGSTPANGSQGVYRALLEEIQDDTGLRLRVLVDIIAGASAGGLNGVFLAQAIATGQSLEPLGPIYYGEPIVDREVESSLEQCAASRNALRHGLSTPARFGADLPLRYESFASSLAAGRAKPEEAARVAAELKYNLDRIDGFRQLLLSATMVDLDDANPGQDIELLEGHAFLEVVGQLAKLERYARRYRSRLRKVLKACE